MNFNRSNPKYRREQSNSISLWHHRNHNHNHHRKTPKTRRKISKMNNSIPNPGSGPTNVDADNHDRGDALVSSSDGTQQIREEIPFLVTHWLANYGNSSSSINNNSSSNNNNNNNNNSKEAQDREQMALAKIRRATSEIASALNTLGAYGTTLRVSELHYYYIMYCLSISFQYPLFCLAYVSLTPSTFIYFPSLHNTYLSILPSSTHTHSLRWNGRPHLPRHRPF